MRFFFALAFLLLGLLAAPHGISAHEVYVLSPETIAYDTATASPNPFAAFDTNQFQFFFWGFLAFVLVSTVFLASITHRFELFFEPYLRRMRPWAPLIARITLGLCLIASAYNAALFGPELPLAHFGAYMTCVQWLLYAAGVCITVGIYPRAAAGAAMAAFAGGVVLWGAYMLNYANYFGEMLVVLLLAGGVWPVVTAHQKKLYARLEPYAFLILVGSSRVDLQACKLEYSIVSPK